MRSEAAGRPLQPGNGRGGAMYRFLQCTAGQYMTRLATTVTRRVTMRELNELFEKHDFNAFPVVEAGTVLGIVTKFDFLRAFAFTTGRMVPHYDELMRRTVADVMTERRSCRADRTVDASAAVDGGSQGPQLSGQEPGQPVGGYHLTRGRDARAAGDHPGIGRAMIAAFLFKQVGEPLDVSGYVAPTAGISAIRSPSEPCG